MLQRNYLITDYRTGTMCSSRPDCLNGIFSYQLARQNRIYRFLHLTIVRYLHFFSGRFSQEVRFGTPLIQKQKLSESQIRFNMSLSSIVLE